MTHILRITAVALLLLNVACTSGQNKNDESETVANEGVNYGDMLESSVIGKWKNNNIDVDLQTYNNSDTSFRVAVNKDNWKIKMNINPIVTDIQDDGTFVTNYRDTLDQVFHQNRGTWYIDGDSLFLIDDDGITYPYKILINGNKMNLSTVVDYDEDGKKDDYYEGEYIKIKQ